MAINVNVSWAVGTTPGAELVRCLPPIPSRSREKIVFGIHTTLVNACRNLYPPNESLMRVSFRTGPCRYKYDTTKAHKAATTTPKVVSRWDDTAAYICPDRMHTTRQLAICEMTFAALGTMDP